MRLKFHWILLLSLAVLSAGADDKETTNDLANETPTDGKFLILTVATEETSGYKRYQRSVRINGLPVKVLGLGEEWKGGDMANSVGGGQKVLMLRKEVELHKDDPEKIIMFTDSYDVLFNANEEKILEQFLQFNARVLFSAEGFCWPDPTLASKYPEVERGKRFLNSGLFMGYAPELHQILNSGEIANDDDDQLFYTKVFLDEKKRQELNIKLDHRSEIFQNLNGAVSDVELRFIGTESHLQNTVYNTVPLVIHANGPTKLFLNTLGNYLPKSWNSEEGCLNCWEDMNSLEKKKPKDFPKVVVGMFIENPTPFFEEFLHKFLALSYPKDKIHLYIHNGASYHGKQITGFVESHGAEYASVKLVNHEENVKEWHARNTGIEECLKKKCEYYFNVDALAHIDNPHTLKLLIEQNRPVVAPMMIRPYQAWSNFWGSLTTDGFYARSIDYMEIVKGERRGLWNVPFVTSVYLVRGDIIHNPKTKPSYIHNLLDADMAFCTNMRNNDVYLFVTNRLDWGHLITVDNFETTHLNNELYEIQNNRWDWEKRYLHVNYSQNLNMELNVSMPCPDVYWFPMTTERFADELVGEMENFGQWSDGTNTDPRLEGGYESVPTRDIHMKQIGLEPGWLHFLQHYVQPLQQRVYEGYWNDPPRSVMNFVVRYRPDEQPFLKPHHDSSTYTINLALNRPQIDYEGGGCRFVRYNCSVLNTRKGWMLMHPGRLTHYHEGLYTTKGTRYIMISFVDP
ncbi:procollagen-lysine,2-oxoglutarate 5-dioxygenase 1-like isoform X1 [Daphnia pulicaria]|uniref:procollagen-lysine,2-oxoglutarate 5-dioxygenase 1-like isoform X1 n=1 Tax=Daphnia pulicaria TaxID=35523 RepID=UPI001EEB6BD1|nr:procollagen-lysine,2-oxoglutarate 5-dioxygenase 1-like isoform X1 [Daphnia pulicaria]